MVEQEFCMTEKQCLIIAEIGNNHNGCLERAKNLVAAAVNAGADYAKFQIRNLNSLYRNNTIEDLGVEYTKDLLHKYELSQNEHKELFEYCRTVGIKYMCTPWDSSSLRFLEEIGVETYKVASADFDNWPLLEALCATGKPLILSTGMSRTSEIIETVGFLNSRSVNYYLLHCNSTYPAPFRDIELNFLKTLKNIHPNIGYSGHERGISVSIAAVTLGAEVIERHLTFDKNMEGPDHEASLLPEEFKQLVNGIREVELALGPAEISERSLSQGTLLNRDNLGKSIVLCQDVASGDILTASSLEIKAPGQGLSPKHIKQLIGKKIRVTKRKGEFIYLSDLGEQVEWNSSVDTKARWGIPVRPHDAKTFHEEFDAPVYEFHISYSDLERETDFSSFGFLRNKKVIVHAPELFEGSRLLNLCDLDTAEREISISNLQQVCDFGNRLYETLGMREKVRIVANVGGFSTHDFLPTENRKRLYDLCLHSISRIHQGDTKIIPQNMAPFPWHFGGQRYQNIFMEPDEIVELCVSGNLKICLDTSHLSMYCSYSSQDFRDSFVKLIPYTDHIHLSDAKDLNGEGVEMGSGDVDFKFIKKVLPDNMSFIFETWQGHVNRGEGFKREFDHYFRGEF